MPICIYCEKDKPEEEMSLEHVIPQCLGGDYAPDRFKIQRVCRKCNNDLGQFVDAIFERDHLVSSWMHQAAFDCYDHNSCTPLPLVRMGVLDARLPGMVDGEVCESYLGPFGENILWVRPHDENMYWYAGGNPRTTKKVETRAYFFVNERSIRNQQVLWPTFKAAFAKRRVRKILCANTDRPIPKELGFAERDSLDEERISYIREGGFDSHTKGHISINIQFDTRFMSKLARGMGFALFGDRILEGAYAREIFKGIWHRQNVDPEPEIYGSAMFAQMGQRDMGMFARKGAFVLSALYLGDCIAIDCRIRENLGTTIKCIDTAALAPEDVEKFGNGFVLIIFKYLRKSFELSLFEYIRHISGRQPHKELSEVEKFIHSNQGKFKER